TRRIILGVTTILLLLFCLNNFLWNLPVIDFRPFKVGTDLYEKKTAEEKAAASVQIISMKLQNKTSGVIVEMPYKQYMSEYAKYPKTEWSVVDQVKSKPEIEPTKVSDFSISDADGNDVAEDILTDTGHVFLIVAYKLKGEQRTEEVMVPDTVWRTDTVRVNQDSILLVRTPTINGTKQE